jgi:lipopolysaccharide transport system ATP-binding protein
LLKILARISEPSEGSVDLYGKVGSLLEIGTGFHGELTGRDNIFLNGAILGMKRSEIEYKFDEIVAFAEVEKFIDTPVKHYSSGMYLRLAFAVAAHLEPEILLVDEVLAVGDTQFQRKCLGKMGEVAQQGRTVMFVSHNLEAVMSLCPLSLVLEGGRVAYQGDSEGAARHYLGTVLGQAGGNEAHVLYASPVDEQGVAWITRIEVLDAEGQPKDTVSTWDELVLRISYRAVRDLPSAAVLIDIRDQRQQRLAVLDSVGRAALRQGEHVVECHIPRLPLAAGEYTLGAGLALANTEWLWRQAQVAALRVFPRDVFADGRPPTYNRMAVVVEHTWESC